MSGNNEDNEDNEDNEGPVEHLDEIVSLHLDYVKNNLKLFKLKYSKDVYLHFYEFYIKLKNLIILFSCYEYLNSKNMDHSSLIDEFLNSNTDNFDIDEGKLEECDVKILNICKDMFSLCVKKIKQFQKLEKLRIEFENKSSNLTKKDKKLLKKLYDDFYE